MNSSCLKCSQPLVRKADEAPCDFAVRKYCNRQCYRARGLSGPEKWCVWCGKTLVRRLGESSREFVQRSFCRRQCRQDMRFADRYAGRGAQVKSAAEANEAIRRLAPECTLAQIAAHTGLTKGDIQTRLRLLKLRPKRSTMGRPPKDEVSP